MKGKTGIISSRRDLLMDLGTPGDYDFAVYGMYSLRYLNREYNGDVILGYKDSSGVTQGFTPTEIIDGTLTTFANGDHVRVKTFYDQSGNGNDATQTGRYNMPPIVISGTLMKLDGTDLPAIDFDGTNDFMPLNSALPDIRIGHCSSFTVGEFDGTTLSSMEMMLSLGWTNASARWFAPAGYQGEYLFGYASTWNQQTVSGLDTDPHLHTAIAGSDQGDWRCFIDGDEEGTATRQVRSSAGVYGIGGASSVTSYALDGRVAEVLVFDGDCSTTRAAIEKNIMDYYGL
jgi:hypothetical protein